MRFWIVLLPLAGILGLCGCAAKMYRAVAAAPPAAAEYMPSPAPAFEPAAESGAQAGQRAELAAVVDSTRPAHDRIIVYTARFHLSTVDVEAALSSARALCTDAGGYMDALTSDSITMRVPAERFSSVVDEIRKLGQVLSREVNALDVTDEYVDLQLRLRNAEATRDRLLAILEKAQTVKETLEVERELSRVREEIERIKGRLAQLDRQTTFSTITIHFSRPAPVHVEHHRPPTPFAWLDALGVEHVLQLDR